MRTLILGAKGQLGRDLVAVFAELGEAAGFDLPELDITEAEAVIRTVRNFHPDCVINAAAYTNVDGAEDDEETAFRINETGAGLVARAAAEHGVPVVYYSTDYVFDGTKTTPYEPDDPPHPLGAYARSKAAGEAATRAATPCHFVVRTAWLYGLGGNHFVEKILRAAAARATLDVVDDETGSPTHTVDLADATAALCATDAYGVYHAVNAGACTRYEMAQAILRLAKSDVAVTACGSAAFPTKAVRPVYSVLSNRKLEAATGWVMRPWQAALEDYMHLREDVA